MPVHDWTHVDGGNFHSFHLAWVTHLAESLNDGLLPPGCYARSEPHRGSRFDTRPTLEPGFTPERLLTAPPGVRRRLVASPAFVHRERRRSLAIRSTTGHRLVALIEIVSPANKDRARSVSDFADKVEAAIRAGCHVLVVDLLLPGPHDPLGMHGAIWERYGTAAELAEDPPMGLASYEAGAIAEAYVDAVELGSNLPEMPLFLDGGYINVPLQATYDTAYRGLPGFWRDVLEGRREADLRG